MTNGIDSEDVILGDADVDEVLADADELLGDVEADSDEVMGDVEAGTGGT